MGGSVNDTTPALNATDWAHLVLVFYGLEDGQGFSVYGNGVLLVHIHSNLYGTTADSPGSVNGKLVLGNSEPNTFTSAFDHSIDEIVMWNIELSAEEVLELYQSYTSSPRDV